MKQNWLLTIIILIAALLISFFLWTMEIYFFFLPIIFLPFLKFVKFKKSEDFRVCPVCELPADGTYCSRCGTKLS